MGQIIENIQLFLLSHSTHRKQQQRTLASIHIRHLAWCVCATSMARSHLVLELDLIMYEIQETFVQGGLDQGRNSRDFCQGLDRTSGLQSN
jgi:hypothetical protein